MRVARSRARFRIVVAGRRFGKTELGCVESLARGLEAPAVEIAYVFPTMKQAKRVAWRRLKSLARPWSIRINETELAIELLNGSMIYLGGADNPDALRGIGPYFVVLDEWADQDPAVWFEVLRAALADHQGRALFVGTPKGWNHFKDLVDLGEELGTPEWEVFRFTTLDGGNVPAEEIEAARRTMDEKTFRQEFMASFESMTGRVYYAFDRQRLPSGNLSSDIVDAGGPLRVGMDFNVDPMSAVLWSKVGDEAHVWGEIVLRNSNTEEMAGEIRRRFPSPRQVIVYPDPSGVARKTSAPIGQTDLTILRKYGFQVKVPHQAPAIVDRVNEVNAMLCSAAGRRRLLVHPTECRNLVRGLDGLAYKEGTSNVDKSGGLDHITDALGYAIHAEFPIVAKNVLQTSPVRL